MISLAGLKSMLCACNISIVSRYLTITPDQIIEDLYKEIERRECGLCLTSDGLKRLVVKCYGEIHDSLGRGLETLETHRLYPNGESRHTQYQRIGGKKLLTEEPIVALHRMLTDKFPFWALDVWHIGEHRIELEEDIDCRIYPGLPSFYTRYIFHVQLKPGLQIQDIYEGKRENCTEKHTFTWK